ncbi:helix-turn-helix domain-containing protein [Aliikangiella coralliicola]|uniref:Helix-turn-helix domain-containing protein n=1 Tax=Aliikangiella coralliicola TaxID=2592383 RepID=A0A545UHV2_9GAMM|nr:helix-turn-helix domain-containing protein [Aliikangiella coralliicola]TQV89045.1 helix-turn-helix domain-containing protein [Aliikangiella coralliicola]
MQEALERAVQHWNMVAPVVDTPKTPEDYETLLSNLKSTMELVENRPNSPLAGLIKAMSRAAQEYEGSFLYEQQGGALLALRYLIKLHNIKQSDLKEIGSQGVVSEILNGKRSLTLRHVRELSKRFNVSPNTFIDS